MPNTYGLPINNYETTLTNAITAGASSMVVGTVQNPSSETINQNTYLIIDPLIPDKIEVVFVTVIAGTTLTISRGESGTTGKAHDAGAIVIQAFMADTLVDLEASLGTYLTTQLATKPNLVTAGSVGNTASNAGTATTVARSDHVHRVFVGSGSRTASTGTLAITGVGFKPALIYLTIQVSSATAPGCYGISTGSGKFGEFNSVSAVDLSSGGDNTLGSNVGSGNVEVLEVDGTPGVVVGPISFDTDGFTLSFDIANHASTFQYICFG